MKIIEMENAPLTELRAVASELGIPNANRLKKENLMIKIRQYEAEKEGLEVRGGVLEIMNEGIGFLRTNYQIGPDDVYVSQAQLRRYELRGGDLVTRPVPVAESPERVDDALLGEANELQDGLYVGVGAGLLQCVLEPEAPLARHERESDESAPRASGGVRTAGWIGAGILLAAVTLALGLRAGPVDLRPSLRGAGIGAPAARPVMPASRPWDGRSVDHAAR